MNELNLLTLFFISIGSFIASPDLDGSDNP